MLTDRLTKKESPKSRLYDITLESSFSEGLSEEEVGSANEEVYYNTIQEAEQFYIIPQDRGSVCREYRLVGCICCIGFLIVCIGIVLIKNSMKEVGKNLMSQLI